MEEKKLLVLDLDETLIYAARQPLDRPPHFTLGEYYVYKRPYLDHFLASASELFQLGIWSSAYDAYVSEVVSGISLPCIAFSFIWGRSRCSYKLDRTWDEYMYEKRLHKLKKLGHSMDSILIVDDTAEKSRTNYGNAILIGEFKGDLEDRELLHLLKYIEGLRDVPSVRTIENKWWRRKITGSI